MIKLMKRLAYLGTVFLMAAGGLQAAATNRYVATNMPGSAYPFDSWAKAGTNIRDCIIYDNKAPNFYDSDSGPNKTALVYSCVAPIVVTPDSGTQTNGFVIPGVVTNPPLFMDAPHGNYRLGDNSPCRNTGTNIGWMTGAVDRDGRPRVCYGVVDMGAYEYVLPGTLYNFH